MGTSGEFEEMLLDEEVVSLELGDHVGLNFAEDPDDFLQVDFVVLIVAVALLALLQPLDHHYVVYLQLLVVELDALDELKPGHHH